MLKIYLEKIAQIEKHGMDNGLNQIDQRIYETALLERLAGKMQYLSLKKDKSQKPGLDYQILNLP